jgi:uncharacterized protein YbgA (DUF1722 family)
MEAVQEASSDGAVTETRSVTDQIKDILQTPGDNDDNAGQSDSQASGDGVQADDDLGNDGGHGDVDIPEHDGQASVDDDTEATTQDDTDGDDTPVDLAFLAEQLDIDKAELYEVQVSLGDGEHISLGELKDNYKEYGPVKLAREQNAEQADKYQRDVLTTRSQINAMMMVANTPEKKALMNEMMQAAGPMQQTYESQQNQLIADTIPEWSDASVKVKNMQSIVELGRDYGFSEPEMTYTRDARTLRMLRDFAVARARISEMEKGANRVHAAPNKPGKSASTSLTKRRLRQQFERAKSSPHHSDKAGYVKNLIGGK